MKPLSIALVRARYTAFGGAERFVASAMDALRAQGAEVTIVTRHWTQQQGIGALVLDPVYLGSVWRDWSFANAVCRELKRHSFDLVQSHERIACCDIYRAGDGVHREWLAQRRRALGRWQRLGLALNPYHRYMLAAEKKLFRSQRLKAVICNSRMVKDEIVRWFGVPAEKLHVIYSGVDTTAFHPNLKATHRERMRADYGIPPDAKVFLLVGSGFERKGVAQFLHALARLPSTAHALIVGKDKRIGWFHGLAERLKIADRVYFAGGLADVKPCYGTADVFVLPTLYDPFPNVALEAMACGLPVITSSKSGAAELIERGVNGFVCDALDVTALSDCMRQVLEADAAAMGLTARATVEAMTFEAMSGRLIELYRGLLAKA